MTCSIDGPSLSDFQTSKTVDDWLKHRNRRVSIVLDNSDDDRAFSLPRLRFPKNTQIRESLRDRLPLAGIE